MSDTKERKSMIKVRGGYSDRNGYNLVCHTVQVDDFDDRTRVILSNAIVKLCDDVFPSSDYLVLDPIDKERQDFLKAMLSEVFNETNFLKNHIDEIDVFKKLDSVCKSAYKNEVLDLIEFICNYIYQVYQRKGIKSQIKAVYKDFNALFEKEFVGYRFVGEHIVAITDDVEIKEIEQSLSIKFKGCKTQIQNALRLLSDRENPDYKNSIKESISAVESICQIITENNKATLGQALKNLEDKGIKMHSALKNAFSSLYGYTSDEGGIRHAEGMFESEVTFEEAKFMLVSCCAFVNYLIAEYGKIKG